MKTSIWINPHTGDKRIYLHSEEIPKSENAYLEEIYRSDTWSLYSVADESDDYMTFGKQMRVISNWIKSITGKDDASFSDLLEVL